MTDLLPTRQASVLQEALLDYLTTTFALADPDAQAALETFLTHGIDGIFRGPFVRTRLPFAPAASGWETLLDVLPDGFTPYGHQAAAFARLSSRAGRPQPTLVTTGTGSGKTEAFLLPILDHVLRARREGVTGLKALILYPMNALANDQAARLASLITAPATTKPNPYAGITAALYTGEADAKRTKVTPDGLITERSIIRQSPPDILLTNYKMLDHLLLRADDARLWQASADSLQYIVLDEFHTYDGAQGTDVAMLLRRLGLTLKSHWPARGSDADTHDAAAWGRPLGNVTPVGTSATLGDDRGSTAMLDFASEIFGEPFAPDAVITESRLALDEWLQDAALPAGLTPAPLSSTLVDEVDALPDDAGVPELLAALSAHADPEATGPVTPADLAGLSNADLLRALKALPVVQHVLRLTPTATPLDALVDALLPLDARGTKPDAAASFVSRLVAALSHLRAQLGRTEPSVEVHLWIRELTRIDREASTAASYRWGDDGSLLPPSLGETSGGPGAYFPAIYCRHCGRSGWGVELSPTGQQLSLSDKAIRSNHLAKTGRFRALISAPSEALRALEGDDVEGLTWLHVGQRELTSALPDPDDADYRHGRLLPVLAWSGKDADEHARRDDCPSCQQRDGIRFLGSAIATLLSVSLTTLFGTRGLDPREKKALVFTDSVQDAAHRAGFVAARSHAFSLRAAMRDAVGSAEKSLPELADAVIARAGDDTFARYRILPASFTADEKLAPFWTAATYSAIPVALRRTVRERLVFDLALEFGAASRIGRTLEATGTVGVQVEAGTPDKLATLAKAVLAGDDAPTLDEGTAIDDRALVAWVRGVLEHLRVEGGIEHPWLRHYLRSDGNRWFLTGGRPDRRMPSFPVGRKHPAFPRIGGKAMRDALLDTVTDTQSWYARWTARTLGLSPQHGARLARGLLNRLAKEQILRTEPTDSGGVVYTVPAASILIAPASDADLRAGRHQLVCDVCDARLGGTVEAVGQLDGAPCQYVRCSGRLHPAPIDPDNYYRRLYTSADMRRIVAREHSSLLDTDERLSFERGFKAGHHDPSAPNTLVATPTLEMGIDIGDLSAVFLASLPRTVASYLQRIGRAGRQTGNALNLSFVTGRGENLPRLGDPGSIINGVVRPPSIYLSAQEILQRQYLAHLADAFARDGVDTHHPRTARGALESTEPGSFLGALIEDAETHADERLDTFLATFGDFLREESVASLRAWAAPGAAGGLAETVRGASARWRATRDELKRREVSIQNALPALAQAAELPAATDDDRRSLQTANAALRLVQARLADLSGTYWIAALEEFGLLPNYTLLGDSATLDVALSWYDPDTGTWGHSSEGLQRPVSQALREFAPGSHFYARGLEIEVDALDLGTDADGVRNVAYCPDCGYAVDTEESGASAVVGACPRCGASGLADTGQRLPTVELKRASAAIRRDEARIDDRSDERRRTPYNVVVLADIDPAHAKDPWYVDGYDFGAKYLSRVTVRWLNLGRRLSSASPVLLGGVQQPASMFRVCEACGHLDNSARSNSMDEHRPWCRHRKSPDEHTTSVVLARTLHTQGVLLSLPWNVAKGDAFAVPSLQAALLLGLRDEFGGSPDHIGVALVRDPSTDGPNAEALLLHDTVPGGTGYLADLAHPAGLWRLLTRALATVSECACQHEGRLACHRCLLPFAPPGETDRVSRSSAERHLRAILGAGVALKDAPPAEPTWTITQVKSAPATGESALEVRFRTAFRALAEGLGGTVTEVPTASAGNELRVTIGSTPWTLRPQVLHDGVQPDFDLVTNLPGVPALSIFLDGYTFHATPLVNRVEDDALKRAKLRARGIRVLGITWADLDAFDAHAEAAPPWLNATLVPGLTQIYGAPPGVVTASMKGPMAQLAQWLQQPQPDDHARFAAGAPALLPQTRMLSVPERADLTAIAEALMRHPDDMDAAGAPNGWWWKQGALGVLVRPRPGLTTASGGLVLDVAVLLDASPAEIAAPGFREAWHAWLQVSNLLAFRSAALQTEIGVVGHRVAPAPTTVGPRRAAVEGRWADMLAALRVGTTAGPEEELAEALVGLRVPAPDFAGEEVGADNIPVDFAWTAQRVAVLLEPDERDVADLEAEGWRVFANDPDAIATALEEAR